MGRMLSRDLFHMSDEGYRYLGEVFNRFNQTVRETIDPARLLVFDVKEGWEPGCRLLGVAQPDEPFPRLNDTATIQAMMKQLQEEARRQ